MTDEALASPRSLRQGSTAIALGLAFFGMSTYVFTVVASRSLGPDRFADFSVFWGLTYGIGLGVSLPFEQETSRRVSTLAARGESVRGVLRVALLGAAVVALPVTGLLAPIAVVLADGAQAWLLWACSSVSMLSLAVAYLMRGVLSGSHHLRSYSVQFLVEGAVRLALVFVLAGVGATSPWLYAVVVPAALILAIVSTLHVVLKESRIARPAPENPLPTRAFLATLLGTMVATTISSSLVNFGPVVVKLLTPSGVSSDAGSFLASAMIARVPILLFAAVQAVLIPRLVRALVARDHAAFARTLRLVLLPTAAMGIVGILVCLSAGPLLLRLFAGPGYSLSRTDITLLGVSTALYLLTLVLQPAAFTLERHSRVVLAWVAAAASFAVACLLPGDPVRVVGIALVVASAVAAVALAFVVRRAAV